MLIINLSLQFNIKSSAMTYILMNIGNNAS